MSSAVRPLPLTGPLFDGAIEAYGAAFSLPPYADPGRAIEIRIRLRTVHGLRPGFRALCATDASGEVTGFVYGYHAGPGQWWHDSVRLQLPEDRWHVLDDAFEVTELAVAPEHQGQGIGGRLLSALLEPCRECYAVLSTRCDSRAHLLYRRLGFEEQGRMTFEGSPHPYFIMAKALRRLAVGR